MDGDAPVALILAGGSGTRFWPLSRADKPKQYLSLVGDRSLIQQTADRMRGLVPDDRLFVCSAKSQLALLREQLPALAKRDGFFLEPVGRNTAPAFMLCAIELTRRGFSDSTPLIALPADHHIGRPDRLIASLSAAVEAARREPVLVTLGIVPTTPHTGYGYIEAGEKLAGEVLRVARFVEKPDRARAESFLSAGNFYWNAGIFVWTLGAIKTAFRRFLPREWERFERGEAIETLYASLTSAAIDTAVLEKADNVRMIPADMEWSDIGSWDALYRLQPEAEKSENAVLGGDVANIESRGCLVHAAGDKKIALVGVEDLIIVDTGDTLLIASRSHDQKVRDAAKTFDK